MRVLSLSRISTPIESSPVPASSKASRRLLATVFAVGLGAATLTACSPSDDGDTGRDNASAAGCVESGDASEAVSVSGELGSAPEVSFDGPVDAASTERTVVIEGDESDMAETGDTVTVSYTLYNGTTGEEIESTGHAEDSDRVPFALDESLIFSGIVRALTCSVEGERLVAAIAPDDAFGEGGNSSLGVDGDDTIVFVFDVLSVAKPIDAAADMVVVEPGSQGMPTVDYEADGSPTVSFPDSAPLDELTLAVMTEGDGDVVGDGDTVEVHYTGVNWDTGEEFDSSWTRGAPAAFPTSGVIPGFSAALVGQTVGSQVLVVVPPAYGYGEAGQGTIGGTDTIVFAVDILGTTAG